MVTDVPDDAKVMTEEPFGPIAIVTFKSFDEVVERANSLPFGLAAYAFTSSNSTAAAIGDAMQSGMVGVNSIAISTPERRSAASGIRPWQRGRHRRPRRLPEHEVHLAGVTAARRRDG